MEKPSQFLLLVDAFASLPGVGSKAATRMAYHLLAQDTQYVTAFAQRITNAKIQLTFCHRCGNIGEADYCSICTNPVRNQGLLCVVAGVEDIYMIEQSGSFDGVYHVLGGELSARKNVTVQDIRLNRLYERVHDEGIRELIIATNPTIEGETTAAHIRKSLANVSGLTISRIAMGLPMNSSLDYADPQTLASSFKNRRKI